MLCLFLIWLISNRESSVTILWLTQPQNNSWIYSIPQNIQHLNEWWSLTDCCRSAVPWSSGGVQQEEAVQMFPVMHDTISHYSNSIWRGGGLTSHNTAEAGQTSPEQTEKSEPSYDIINIYNRLHVGLPYICNEISGLNTVRPHLFPHKRL